MRVAIREYRPEDKDAVIALSLRAWAPEFASLQDVLGTAIFDALHGEWRRYQAGAVSDTLEAEETRTWVAEAEQRVIGFVAARRHEERRLGEILMLAVDPDEQARGVGSALTAHATDWLRDRGMKVAMVETGGDAGHAAARRVYEKAAYTPLPVVRYFRAL